jgi:cephalosporin hydroxylase
MNNININKSEVNRYNKIISSINSSIKGRVCVSDSLHLLLFLKEQYKPSVYLETGSLFGGSICSLLGFKDTCEFYGVDPFDGYYGKGVNDPLKKIIPTIDIAYKNIEQNNIHNHKVELIKGSSYDIDVVKQVKEKIEKIDLFFIDGDHSKTGVLNDYNNYKDIIAEGGIIVFDNYGHPSAWTEVKPAVDSIKFQEDGFEVIGRYLHSFVVLKSTKK